MTREEAKELLLHILMTYVPKDQYGDYDYPEPYEQALTMAIEALSADTVSREVYDAMVKHAKALENLSIEDRVRIMYDAVEDIHNIRIINDVVWCKDCRHRDLFSCPLADNDFQKDEDYCSWGERREP